MIKNLRLLREENGISQQKLAEMLNISQQAVFKYEKTASEPDISTLIKIADIFNVTVDYLIGNSEIKEKNAPTNAVILTEQEDKHIKHWRALPNEIQENMDNLIISINSAKS
ncbi:MAG: helix-turn-helix transcriptional regulator [Oscillospiraceae bacterium]|nr:helix-turn-helix transcriptional regulator [Oscillospiraceae bacterium]